MYDMSERRGLIFGIKKFSLNDGPGIRTTVFIKGCPLRCPWCHNPEGLNSYPELFFNAIRCLNCKECIKACPYNIDLHTELNKAQNNMCVIKCGKCVAACPTEAISIIGKNLEVGDVLREVLSDIVFYQVSGGGVTLSGGEPLSGGEFTLDILRSLKSKGLHVAIETCCYGNHDLLRKIIDYVDLFIVDVKFGKPEDYEKYVSAGNGALVFENLHFILQSKVPKIIRFPCIPGYTDNVENVQAIVREITLQQVENLQRIEILPYNALGEGKYRSLGYQSPIIPREYRLNPLKVAKILNDLGFPTIVLGVKNE